MDNPIYVDKIAEPSVRVSPPMLVVLIFTIVLVAALVVFVLIPFESDVLKWGIAGIYSIVLIGILMKFIRGNYLVTMRANKDGIFFQSNDEQKYFYIPWNNIGIIECTVYPLNARGLRFEILKDSIDIMKNTKFAGEVRIEKNRTFVYTTPQLNNREKLIAKFIEIKNGTRFQS